MRASGRQLAQYLCDSRDDFLEVVFGEIKNFSDEFDLTVKVRFKVACMCTSRMHACIIIQCHIHVL